MKHLKIKNIEIIIRGFIALIVASFLGASALAGPGGGETYLPIKTMKEAEAIKTGDRVAIACGNCGGVTTFIAGEDRSFLHGYVCANCKKKFVTRVDAHGGVTGSFVYEDDAGHLSRLLRTN